MVDLSVFAEKEETVSLPPQVEAVTLQEQIEKLKLQIEELTARRDEALAEAYANGIRAFGGYRFTAAKPADSLSESKLAKAHPEVMDGYTEWYLKTREVKLTKTDLKKFLKVSGNPDADKVIEDITVEGKGGPTYRMTKEKEVEE